jgi:hypothetical protein
MKTESISKETAENTIKNLCISPNAIKYISQTQITTLDGYLKGTTPRYILITNTEIIITKARENIVFIRVRLDHVLRTRGYSQRRVINSFCKGDVLSLIHI